MALPVNGSTHLIPTYYLFIDPERMKGWVGLVFFTSVACYVDECRLPVSWRWLKWIWNEETRVSKPPKSMNIHSWRIHRGRQWRNFNAIWFLPPSRGGSRGWLGWLVTPLARQPISCYYYVCDLSYFDVVLCPSSSQILAISFSRYPRPPKCSLASLARVPKVTPSKKS